MPHKELERQQAVNKFLKLDFKKEKEFQEIVELAAKICCTDSALITLIGTDTQYIIFKQNFHYKTTSREDAFCDYVIESHEVLIVPDALLDSRFSNNVLVTHDPHIRFYAGAPLNTVDGLSLGSLCVIDQKPKDLNGFQIDMLKVLSKQVVQLMNFDASLSVLKEMYIEARQSEIELRSFFESSIDHYLLLGKNFEVLAFNKSWESHVKDLYGIQMQKGKSMLKYINVEHLHLFYNDYLQALSGTSVYEERNLRQLGKDHWRLVKFEPAYNLDAEIIGVSVNVADVNRRVENEQRVKIQNERLNEIAFIQSHEFRKPVASILGLLNLIKLDPRFNNVEEFIMLNRAVMELDEKIKFIMSKLKES